MKKFLLIALIAANFVSCQENNPCSNTQRNALYHPGDMIKTKFGTKALIVDTLVEGHTLFYGTYSAKTSDTTTFFHLCESEIAEKI